MKSWTLIVSTESCLLTLLVFIGTVQSSQAADPMTDDVEPAPTLKSEPIHTGFVLIDGKYIESPYIIISEKERLTINGHPISINPLQLPKDRPRARQRSGIRGGPRRGPGRTSMPQDVFRKNRQPDSERASVLSSSNVDGNLLHQQRVIDLIEKKLKMNATLVAWQGKPACFVANYLGVMVLADLSSDKSSEEKIDSIIALDIKGLTEPMIIHAVEHFEPSSQLDTRLVDMQDEYSALIEYMDRKRDGIWLSSPRSRSIRYTVTVLAMMFGVVALGILLTHRPETKGSWREIDDSSGSLSIVKWCIIMLVVLGLFDLGCTILAAQTSVFVELNPLGGSISKNPIALSALKLGSLLLGCGLLFFLRKYRGAQFASWWLSLVCVVVTFRWAAFNTMLM